VPIPTNDNGVNIYTPLKIFPKEEKFKLLGAVNAIFLIPQLHLLRFWVQRKTDTQTIIGIKYPPQKYLQKISKYINSDVVVSDLVDFHPDDNSWSKSQSYTESLQSSLLGIAVAQKLADRFDGDTPVYHIPNGVEASKYKHYIKNNSTNNKTAGWVGNVNNTLNFDWIEEAAKLNPEIEFVFIGPVNRSVEPTIQRLEQDLDNLNFSGPRHPSEVPEIISTFDVGLIPDEVTELAMHRDTMKIYEYFACAIPVVSSNVPPAQNFKQYIKIAKNKEEFSELINELEFNSNRTDNSLVELAEKNSWDKRIDQLMTLIEERLE